MSENVETARQRDRVPGPSQRHWQPPDSSAEAPMASNVAVEMGWGRLLFAHTFDSLKRLADTLRDERPGKRDLALYVRDPHVLVSLAPQELFLDPSHTFRVWPHSYRRSETESRTFRIRSVQSRADIDEVNRIHAARGMVAVAPDAPPPGEDDARLHLVAEDTRTGRILATVMGVDHVRAFNDPEQGSSLWCLAVDPQVFAPGAGEAVARAVVEHYFNQGRQYLDLSVMHDNRRAIKLYEMLGFQRVPVFCVKRKNPINEPLFIAPSPDEALNPYAGIIVHEARRRGIVVEVLDAEAGYFSLHFGGRSIVCRESLSELTTAVAMSRCDDKRVTRRILGSAGLRVPAQTEAGTPEENEAFLHEHPRLVVKPASGEQGAGVTVDIRAADELQQAVESAGRLSHNVLLEEFVEGQDLRIIVIDFQVVAAAIRRPPQIVGTGKHTARELIEKYNRRRAAATGGESRVPLDDETRRCVAAAGRDLDAVLSAGEAITVRKAANLHTGGTIHDATERLHPALAEAAVAAARALDIPVVGLDFIVEAVDGDQYHIIEANERPGLANHEPQPTAERFIDLLFPNTAPAE
jgi:GNAT-family acetyltransferase (TIGR03103 family)